MAGDPRVFGLLEEMLDAGKTPDEVCRGCPELLAEVRERWKEFRSIDAAVVELLPGLRTALDVGAVTPVPPPPTCRRCPQDIGQDGAAELADGPGRDRDVPGSSARPGGKQGREVGEVTERQSRPRSPRLTTAGLRADLARAAR
jgi:hypothetical protein